MSLCCALWVTVQKINSSKCKQGVEFYCPCYQMPLDPELSALQVELKMFALPVQYTINSQDIVDIELSFIELLNYRYCLFQG